MAPIKIKLSLSSASVPSASGSTAQIASRFDENHTPKKGGKAPQHARTGLPSDHGQLATPEAGPSRLRGDPPGTVSPALFNRTPIDQGKRTTPVVSASTPSKPHVNASTPSSSKSKLKAKSTSKSAKKTKRPTAIPSHLLPSAPSTPKSSPPPLLNETPSPGLANVKQEDVEMRTDTPHTGSPSVEPDQMATPGGYTIDNDEIGTPTTAQKQSVRWMRIKRPLREHATKIVADLIKRDEVSFSSPFHFEESQADLAV